MSEIVDFQVKRVKDLESRVQSIESLGDEMTLEDQEDLTLLKESLQSEKDTLAEWENILDRGNLRDMASRIFRGDTSNFEKDWAQVFEFFPGTRAAFQEIANLDKREEELFIDRRDPDFRLIWRESFDLVMSLWNPYKEGMSKKMRFLGAPRNFSVTMTGRVYDQDNLSGDDILDINESFSNTMRFGEFTPIVKQWTADNEVTMKLNVTCRFKVNSDETNPPLLEITGEHIVDDVGEEQGRVSINTQLSSGKTSGEFKAGDEDHGIIKFRFDLTP